MFLVAVNHAGDIADPRGIAGSDCARPDGTHRWPGSSFVIAPDGALLAESDPSHNRQRMLVADLTAARFETRHRDHLEERRPQTYGALTNNVREGHSTA
jgi:predicted amidohydrolase